MPVLLLYIFSPTVDSNVSAHCQKGRILMSRKNCNSSCLSLYENRKIRVIWPQKNIFWKATLIYFLFKNKLIKTCSKCNCNTIFGTAFICIQIQLHVPWLTLLYSQSLIFGLFNFILDILRFHFIFQNSNVVQRTTIAVKTHHSSADGKVLHSMYL